jgi:hypothetical protein
VGGVDKHFLSHIIHSHIASQTRRSTAYGT